MTEKNIKELFGDLADKVFVIPTKKQLGKIQDQTFLKKHWHKTYSFQDYYKYDFISSKEKWASKVIHIFNSYIPWEDDNSYISDTINLRNALKFQGFKFYDIGKEYVEIYKSKNRIDWEIKNNQVKQEKDSFERAIWLWRDSYDFFKEDLYSYKYYLYVKKNSHISIYENEKDDEIENL